MSKQVLYMKYHPAKKEIEFRRFQSGEKVKIKKGSKLRTYMNQRGTFVLQNYGRQFFDDIAEVFDGEKKIDIKVMTTAIDYDDFCQMIENYNESNECKCQFSPELVCELPDMNQTFEEVKRYGQQSIGILDNFRNELDKPKFENDKVKEFVSTLDNQVKVQITEIKDKIESLNDNRVNLCFTGVYSSGKSTLINALLGYKILPENIKSETAKMIEICSPRRGEKVKIKFKIYEEHSEIEWNEGEQCFEFIKGPSECDVRTKLQDQLNDLQSKKGKQHEQIYGILKELNSDKDISSTIEVFFPIALDNENFQFKIFDTPGSDSNCPEHQIELQKALKEQTQSILIFVATPDRLEGTGNNSLLNELTEAGQKSSKTSIDIARSLFVINKADTIEAYEREDLQSGEIKSQGNPIKLNDKKLFFISAKNAYAAKSIKNNIADRRERLIVKKSIPIDEKDLFYKQNQCATSELATKKMIAKCDKALEEAEQKEKDEDIVWISSGLYALENEIIQYAEKFASSVRAFAIIDSMDKVVNSLTQEAKSLQGDNQKSIEDIDDQIEKFKKFIFGEIEDKKSKMLPQRDKNEDSERIARELGVDSPNFRKSVIDPVIQRVDEQFSGWFLGYGKITVKDGDNDKIKQTIESLINQFNDRCISKRNQLIEKKKIEFIESIKDVIRKNGDISEELKKSILNIPVPEINIDDFTNWDKIYAKHIYTDKLWFFETKSLDKEGLIKDIDDELSDKSAKLFDRFIKDYSHTLEEVIKFLKNHFIKNLDKYSLKLKAMNESKKEMKQLGKEIHKIVDELGKCKKELDEIIWGGVQNV